MGADTSAVFNGTNYVDAGTSNNFAGTSAYSVEAWVKPSDTSGAMSVIGRRGSGMDGWAIYLNSATINFATPVFLRTGGGTSTYLTAAPRFSARVGEWRHLVGTYDGTYLRIYVDGQQANVGVPGTSIATTTQAMTLAKSGIAAQLRGSLDEVAVYNRALSPNEVQSHTANCTYASVVSRTSGLRSYYRLDEASGNAVDSGPNGITGNYANNPTRGASGALPSGTRTSMQVAATSNQYVNLGQNYNFSGTAPFSVEAWVRPTRTPSGASQRIVQFTQPGNNWSLLQEDGGGASMQRWGGFTPTVNFGPFLPNNVWAYLAGTYDGSTLRLYVNGTLVASGASTQSINATTDIATISAANNTFDGSIDEVAIYDRALTAGEVSEHFAAR